MKLTRNEEEILEVLWEAGRPLTGSEIVSLSVEKHWKDSSIHILINSLLKKGAIVEAGFMRTGKTYGRTFIPSDTGKKYYTDVLVSIAHRISVPTLFSALFDSKDISKETIEELEVLIQKKKQEF